MFDFQEMLRITLYYCVSSRPSISSKMNETLALDAESRIKADIDELRLRFEETRALYKEVCGLLFFRYGVVPTANRLYSLVRKGSMGVPGEVLAKFWQELRERTRVRIEHPEMPEAIKQVAAEAVLNIWKAASGAAAGELAEFREQAQLKVDEAEHRRQQALSDLDDALHEIEGIQAQLLEAKHALSASQDGHQAERTAHAATVARLQETLKLVEDRDRHIAEARIQFSAELDHARQQVVQAEERAAGTERRVMRDLDQERTLRQKSERLTEDLRTELSAMRVERQDAAVRHADSAARHQSEIQGLEQRLSAGDAERGKLLSELASVRTELADALRRVERAEAEVEVTRRLVGSIRKGPADKPVRRRDPTE
ncbi:DNA-binding protein [Ralstonia pseudosolanacearum]|uniref:DNA-binding protein n=1 Tax=Ralstonia pseudosolanacearum TaxID=1310165 RepID=UPI003CEF7690